MPRAGRSATSIASAKWYLKHVATEIADGGDDIYFDGAQTTVAIDKLGHALERGGKPFFLAVGYYRPHLPFNVPEEVLGHVRPRGDPAGAKSSRFRKDAPLMAVNTAREIRGYSDFKSDADSRSRIVSGRSRPGCCATATSRR